MWNRFIWKNSQETWREWDSGTGEVAMVGEEVKQGQNIKFHKWWLSLNSSGKLETVAAQSLAH